jgi:hypothetical protein
LLHLILHLLYPAFIWRYEKQNKSIWTHYAQRLLITPFYSYTLYIFFLSNLVSYTPH